MNHLKMLKKTKIKLLINNNSNLEIEEDFFYNLSHIVLSETSYPLEIAEISIKLTDDKEMRKLNNKYRSFDNTTDVLSFPMNENKDIGENILGDIVISVDMLKEQAKRYDMSINDELAFLYIHGLLHLLGYDHEKNRSEENDMFNLQNKILVHHKYSTGGSSFGK